MNQILFKKIDKKNLLKYKFLLYFSIFFAVVFCIYLLIFHNDINKKEKYSKSLLNSFNIEKLYSSINNNYTVVELNKNSNYFVMGFIEIDKIDLRYPILSELNDELLKISLCRFYGPFPNKIGNLCIAGHNYDDNRFFGNLYKLNTNDIIKIYDSNNYCVFYYVYDMYETLDSDTSCTSQSTNGNREITLITCNNKNKKRLIVKAKEK